MIPIVGKIPQSVYLAYSGGIDSSFALHFLTRSKTRKVHCIHINHYTPNANKYEAFCRATAQQYDVPFTVYSIRGNNEHEWHEERYRIFHGLELPIITCHHKDDSLENLVMFGQPILYQNKNVIRPFLNFTKKAIYEYVARYNINYVHDETNDDVNFTLRNQVRVYMQDLINRGCPLYKVLSGYSSIGQSK